MILYNGVEFPDIESVWTDKVTWPYAVIVGGGPYSTVLYVSNAPFTVGSTYLQTGASCKYRDSYFSNGSWGNLSSESSGNNTGIIYPGYTIWANHDVLKSDGTVYLAASDPVDPNAPVESPVMDIISTTADSSSIRTDFNVSGISADSLYTISVSCFYGEQVVGSTVVGPYSGPEFQATVSVDGLSPSTEYTVEYQLSKDGEYTGVSQIITVTTAAASGSGSGDGTGDSSSCACPSILNSILSAITAQSNFLSTWQQTWTTRMNGFESTLSKLIPVPDPTETALKESVKDTTKEVTDSLFADDAPTKVTVSDVKDVAQIGSAASSMFDSGVSVGSFFDAFNSVTLVSFFTQEVYDDLHSASSPAIVSDDDTNSVVEYYNDNLSKIKKFVGGE